MVDRYADLPVARQCQPLKSTQSTVYYRPAPLPEDALTVMRALDEIHLLCPFPGSRRLVTELAKRGLTLNRERGQRQLRVMGSEAIYPKPRTTRPGVGAGHELYPYQLRGVEITRPDQVWVADVTYIPMRAGFAYLVAIMDAYSRRILSWRLSSTADARSCVDYLRYHNVVRAHQGLDGLTPRRVYHHPAADTPVPAIVHRSARLSAPLSS